MCPEDPEELEEPEELREGGRPRLTRVNRRVEGRRARQRRRGTMTTSENAAQAKPYCCGTSTESHCIDAPRGARGEPWASEDLIYRFYHQSFKVFAIQALTITIVDALRALLPNGTFDAHGVFGEAGRQRSALSLKHGPCGRR